MTAFEPMPGMFGLSRIGGALGVGVAAGQHIAGDPSPFTHAFVVVDGGMVVEAMPGGARLAPLAPRLAWRPVAWSWQVVLSRVERADVVEAARGLVGTPYSFLDYASLALLHTGAARGPVLERVRTSGSMICSQLVDEAYLRAGVHLFADGRFPGDVMPGSLANLLLDVKWSDPARVPSS